MNTRLIYVSNGNIPSRWAHTVQTMKMAEALARHVDCFELVTQVHWKNAWRRRFDFETWYGIRDAFPIRCLTTRCGPRRQVSNFVFCEPFGKLAAAHVAKQSWDLVYTRCHFAAAACIAENQPTIYETHADRREEIEERLGRIASSDALRAVVTISDELRQDYVDWGVPADKVIAVADAVDIHQWNEPTSQAEARIKLAIDPAAYCAAYCGHLYDHRGIEDILAAARRLPDVQFVLVGGWERDISRRRREAAHLNNVQFAGFVPNAEVPDYLAAADCLLLPYSAHVPRVESMSPLKIFESMAANRPVIASDLPAIRKHLRHGENACLATPDCGESLARAIESLRDDHQLAQRLAAAAFRDVQAHTWDARAETVLTFVDQRCRSHEPTCLTGRI